MHFGSSDKGPVVNTSNLKIMVFVNVALKLNENDIKKMTLGDADHISGRNVSEEEFVNPKSPAKN